MAASSSYMTFLMYKKGSSTTYEKLIDIKEFPDLGKAPDTLDATTLSDGMKVGIPDIIDPGTLEFTANYDKADFEKIKALEGVQTDYAIWVGGTESSGTVTPNGNKGKFSFKGDIRVWLKGASVSAVLDMGISITPSTVITES